MNVHFVGFVNIPGVHMIHPFSNVISGLTQAGGIKENGSLREVHLIRDGKTIGKVDIYKYIFSGENIGDLRLIDQDVISGKDLANIKKVIFSICIKIHKDHILF